MKLERTRVEDVPVPELSGLAVTGAVGGVQELLAIGDRKSVLARATLLIAGDRGVLADVFEKSSSSGEGLLPLSNGRFLVAKEKDPPLLVEFGPRGADAETPRANLCWYEM